jgi:antitoxin MazE
MQDIRRTAMKMQIGKWGNSLAVRLPKEIVERFHLKEGDSIDMELFGRALQRSQMTREEALKRLVELQRPLPPDYKFDREEANSR